jgi:hypothetical protein
MELEIIILKKKSHSEKQVSHVCLSSVESRSESKRNEDMNIKGGLFGRR